MTLVGGRSLRIRPEDRSLYHAAAVMASNYIGLSFMLLSRPWRPSESLAQAGTDCAISPGQKASVDNSLRLGPVEALTGPIERGDSATVLAHLEGLAKYFPAGEATVLLCRTIGGPNGSVARFAEQ